MSEREVHTMVQQYPDGLRLVKKVQMGSPYPEKPGTLTMTQERREVAFALEVLKRRIGNTNRILIHCPAVRKTCGGGIVQTMDMW